MHKRGRFTDESVRELRECLRTEATGGVAEVEARPVPTEISACAE
jgi:hypothetical protein